MTQLRNETSAPAAPPGLRPAHAMLDDGVAGSAEAAAHFESLLRFETDCWDVHDALERRLTGFVVLDVRSPAAFGSGHVPGAVNMPHGRIVERNLEPFGPGTLFVVYCSGPHCNGADRAALRLARLGRPVKKMIGGITGWLDEGFTLARWAGHMG